MLKYRAAGKRGSWFATVAGESIPCVHSRWTEKGEYHYPMARPGTPKWDEYLAAIKDGGRVILTRSIVENAALGLNFDRAEHVAVFAVNNVEIDRGGLRFKLGERLMELE